MVMSSLCRGGVAMRALLLNSSQILQIRARTADRQDFCLKGGKSGTHIPGVVGTSLANWSYGNIHLWTDV
jgi:hypothetical protein